MGKVSIHAHSRLTGRSVAELSIADAVASFSSCSKSSWSSWLITNLRLEASAGGNHSRPNCQERHHMPSSISNHAYAVAIHIVPKKPDLEQISKWTGTTAKVHEK